MAPDFANTQQLINAVEDAVRSGKPRRVINMLRNELTGAQRAVRDSWADQHGWQLAKKGFTLHELRNGHHRPRWTDDLWPDGWPSHPLDHSEFYRSAWSPHYPVALVSHGYAPFDAHLIYAKANGLIATLIPESWWDPERAIAVVYTSPLIPFPRTL